MGIKLAKQMGAEVVVLSRSEKKRSEAEKLGASFLVTSNMEELQKHATTFDLIISTVSASYDVNPYINLLKINKMVSD